MFQNPRSQRLFRRSILCLLLLSLGLFPRPACALEKATVQLKWLHHFQFAGYYAALEKGFYREAGLDVTLREGGPTAEVEREVLSGRAEFGVGTSALLLQRAQGNDLVVLGQIFQHSPAVFLTPRETGIRTVADIRGKRVMYSNQHGDMLALLKKNGLDARDIVSVPHEGDPADLLTGKADVMMAYSFNEPFILEEAGEPYLTFSPMKYGIDFYGDNFFTRRSLAESRPEFVRAFREATLRGWRYAIRNKEEIADLILTKYSRRKSRDWLLFEANQMESLIQPDLIELGYQSPSRWQHIADVFVSLGMLPAGFDPVPVIYAPQHRSDYRLLVLVVAVSGVIIGILGKLIFTFRRLNGRLSEEIAERTHMEEELRRNEEKFRNLFHNAEVGMFRTGMDGQMLDVNDRCAAMFGYSRDEALQKPVLSHWADGHKREAMLRLLAEEGRITDFECEILTKTGEPRTCLTSMRLYRDQGILEGSLLDITDQRRMDAERLELERKLLQAQKLESLGVLAGGIAHDFNNILTAIVGNAELALVRVPADSAAREHIQRIKKSSLRAAELANQMLAYSGKGKFVVQPTDLNRLVTEVSALLDVSVSQKAPLSFRLAEPLPPVEADRTQLRQIVMNIIINAAEAMGDSGGSITVTTGSMMCDRVFLGRIWVEEALPEGHYVWLEIADTGCGMDEETKARIFDPFFSTKFTGRGLGMAAALGIVRSHKGAIIVESEPGRGSSFRIFLPACADALPQHPTDRPNEEWRGTGTVLLVDDEDFILDTGRYMLQELGFSVLCAPDGEQAVEIFRGRPDIDYVILDLTMPRLDGREVFRRLRVIRPDVKVIVSSGFMEHEVSQKFVGEGIAGFIQKPYLMSALRETLRQLSERTA